MYRLFLQCDLDWVEINPLAVGSDGAVMALDGKVAVNNDALGRHPELAKLQLFGTAERVPNLAADELSPFVPDPQQPLPPSPRSMTPEGMNLVELGGSIGILCNGAGLVMTTLDLVTQAQGTPAFALNIGGDTLLGSQSLAARLTLGLASIQERTDLKVVLLNLLYGTVERQGVGGAIAPFLKSRDGLRCPVILRWSGIDAAANPLPSHPRLHIFDNLDAAIAKAVAIAYPTVARNAG
jgi:succinyl-CoA synthetase beta subunit